MLHHQPLNNHRAPPDNLKPGLKPEEEVVEGATSRKEGESLVQEGAMYLRGKITRPLEGVKRIDGSRVVGEFCYDCSRRRRERQRRKDEKEEEEDKDVLKLLNRSSEESDDYSDSRIGKLSQRQTTSS